MVANGYDGLDRWVEKGTVNEKTRDGRGHEAIWESRTRVETLKG